MDGQPNVYLRGIFKYGEKLTGASCLRNSGRECITKSPWFVRHVRQFSLYSLSTFDTKVVNPIFLIRAPSCAVSLYFPQGFNAGSINILNCSSEAIRTL